MTDPASPVLPARSRFILLAGAGLAVLPLLALILFAAPQADDFCYAAAYRLNGWLGGLAQFRGIWTARVSSTVLIFSPFAAGEAPGAILLLYRLQLMAIALIWGGLCWSFADWAAPGRAGRPVLALMLGAAMLVWTEYAQTGLWMPAASAFFLTASLSGAVVLLLFRPVLADQFGAAVKDGPAHWTLIYALALAAGLANEFTPAALGLFALASLAARWPDPARRRTGAHIGLLGLAAACQLVFLTASGNAGRMNEFNSAGSLLETLLMSPLYALEVLIQHALMPPHIAWYALLAAISGLAPRAAHPARARRAALILLIAGAAAIAVGCAAGVWGLGNRLPGRAQSQLHLMAAIPFSLTLMLYIRSGGSRLGAWLTARLTRRPALFAAFAAAMMWVNLTSYPAWSNLLSGDAARFAQSIRDRLALLSQAPDGAALALLPLAAEPDMLIPWDYRSDPNMPVCAARLYRLERVSGL